MARDAGANRVYFASAAPPVRYPNVYGIDMPTRNELIAHDRDQDGVRQAIGADALVYQSVADLAKSVREINPQIERFDSSCFDGVYVTGDVSPTYLDRIEAHRQAHSTGRSGQDDESDRGRLDLQAPAEA